MTQFILHLSDLHVGRSAKEGENLNLIVEKIINRWANENNKPVILITGDLVDDGEEKQFIEARQILNPIYAKGFTVLPVPGNHDYGWNGNHAKAKRFKHFKNAFFPFEYVGYPFSKEIGGHLFIGLNSMKAEEGFFDGLLADGELGGRQIDDTTGILKKTLARNPYQKVIIYLHHHPFLFPDDSILETIGEKIGHWLKDGDDFMNKIMKRTDILLFGHEHRHIDFSGTQICRKYEIPKILSCSKSTDETMKEYNVEGTGKSGATILNEGLMGRLITIEDNGDIKAETLVF